MKQSQSRFTAVVGLAALLCIAALAALSYMDQQKRASDLAEHCAKPAADPFRHKLACMSYGR